MIVVSLQAAVHNLLWPALLHFSALSIFGVTATPWTISVDTKEAIFETSPNFVGFTIDASTFEPGLRHNWDSFDTRYSSLRSFTQISTLHVDIDSSLYIDS